MPVPDTCNWEGYHVEALSFRLRCDSSCPWGSHTRSHACRGAHAAGCGARRPRIYESSEAHTRIAGKGEKVLCNGLRNVPRR